MSAGNQRRDESSVPSRDRVRDALSLLFHFSSALLSFFSLLFRNFLFQRLPVPVSIGTRSYTCPCCFILFFFWAHLHSWKSFAIKRQHQRRQNSFMTLKLKREWNKASDISSTIAAHFVPAATGYDDIFDPDLVQTYIRPLIYLYLFPAFFISWPFFFKIRFQDYL